ncbi:cytochrome P450 [Mytilinidion resinicola]|uniref:Cytochrome P450 n=1 Tax=Mytilinidion resinicola TaxID=574789 RepID=A0A6A6YTA9_9PEZI|nr:cytochrome P450 [Mytilinidion resinicola]KAF2811147.1 cytochrome P450 [Mytilinidion resinicola]
MTSALGSFVYCLILAISLALGLSSLTVVGICAYRLWLHPLSKYPGPFWGKITNLHAAYHSWKGDLHLDMWRCHEKYGDHIRYGPDRLIFNTADEFVLDVYSSGKDVHKCKGYLTMMHRVPNTITQRNKTLHARQRRLLSHGFSDAALRSYEETIDRHVQRLCEKLGPDDCESDENWSCAKDMSKWTGYITFDIMLDIIYGRQSAMITKAENRYLLEAIEKSNIRVGVLMPLWHLKGSFIERYLFPSSIVARYEFLAFVKNLLKTKDDEGADASWRQSVYSILKGSEGKEGLGPNEIAAESTNLIVAGSDTTSTVLAAALFYLSRDPTAYAKVAAEVRSCFHRPADLHNRSLLHSCLYLRACIEESMRMAPPIASALFREVDSGGTIIDGHFIPAGIDIGTSIYSIHHNSQYFPEPFQFLPERWLPLKDGSNQKDVQGAHSAFMPFSIGSRGCIGKVLAVMELHSILANLLFFFDFRVAEGDVGAIGEGKKDAEWGRHREGEYQLYDHLTAMKYGPFLQFRKREL